MKYLLVLISMLYLRIPAHAQDDTVNSVAIAPYAEKKEWHFTDTLIHQLTLNNLYTGWSRITLIDQIYPGYLNEYTFVPKKGKVEILDATRSKIKSIRKSEIDLLIKQLVLQINLSDSAYLNPAWPLDPLTQFQLDSSWYKREISGIWNAYRIANNLNLDGKQTEAASKALLDYNAVWPILNQPSNWNESESVMIDLHIAYDFDTLHVQATSYFPYALPWYYFNNQTRLHDCMISKTIGEILLIANPTSKNVNRLRGVDFKMALMDDIYKRYLINKIH